MTHVLDPNALPRSRRAPGTLPDPFADVTRSDAAFRRFLHGLPGVDQVGAETRAAVLGTRSIKTTAKAWAIDTAISMVDLTTLEGSDTPGKVRSLAAKARRPDPEDPTLPAGRRGLRLRRPRRRRRRGAGRHRHPRRRRRHRVPQRPGQPRGQARRRPGRRRERRRRDRHGHRPRRVPGRALPRRLRGDRRGQGGLRRARTSRSSWRPASWSPYDNVRRASWLAMLAGGDFIKTSTGKISPGRHAAGLPGDARGRARLPRRHRRARSASSRPAASGRRRTRSSTWCSSTRPPARTGSPPTGSASAPPACSTTCCCSARSSAPATTPAPTTSRWTDMRASSSTPPRPSRARSSTSSPPTACSSTASSSTAPARPFKTVNPATEEVLTEVASGSEADVDRAVARRPPRIHPGLGPDAPGRPRQVPVPHRAAAAGAGARVRRPGDAGQRQADPRVPRRRRPAGRGALLLPRGLGRQARARGPRPGPPAARRGRPGHPVELPAADAGLEGRPGAGHRQHRRPQAGRDHPADGAAVRRGLPAGRPARRAWSTS